LKKRRKQKHTSDDDDDDDNDVMEDILEPDKNCRRLRREKRK